MKHKSSRYVLLTDKEGVGTVLSQQFSDCETGRLFTLYYIVTSKVNVKRIIHLTYKKEYEHSIKNIERTS